VLNCPYVLAFKHQVAANCIVLIFFWVQTRR
jgi:hypothetical protein